MDSSIDMGYYPGSGPRMDPNHPTIANPFQYLTFGQTFSRTFAIFFDHLDTFLALSIVVLIPFAIVVITYVLFVISVDMHNMRDAMSPEISSFFEPRHVPLVVSILVVQLLAYAAFTMVGRGAMCRAVAELYLGQAPQWKMCLWEAWQRRGSLVGSAVLISAGLIVGAIIPYIAIVVALVTGGDAFWWIITILLCGVYVVGASYFYTGTLLVTPALMVEPLPAPGRTVCMEGIRRSWELATGSRCYVGCTLFGLCVLNELVRRLLHNMFLPGDGSVLDEIFFSLVGLIVVVVPMIVFLPLYAILETILYLNLRIGRESLNDQVLRTDLSADRNAPTPSDYGYGYGGAGGMSIPPSSGGILMDGSMTSTSYSQVPFADDEYSMDPATTTAAAGTTDPQPFMSGGGGPVIGMVK